MDRTAVFVDAGYLFASGARLIAGERLARGDLHLDHEGVLELLANLTRELTRLPLLRVYWYDGASAGPTPQQVALAYRPNVKLRLGLVDEQGQQQGVDSLIVADLIHLSRNRAMSDAILLTGDEDLRVAVQQAQSFGVRVHLIGIAPTRDNQSALLVQEADTVKELSEPQVRTFLTLAPSAQLGSPSSSPPGAGPSLHSDLTAVAQRIAESLAAEELDAVPRESNAGSVPGHIDRRLLVAASLAQNGAELSADQKRHLRASFLEACRALHIQAHAAQRS